MWTRLCALSDLPREGARGFTLAQTSLVAVRERDDVYVYLNRCPHLGVPLQWEAGRFLDNEGAFIRCATHGALFEKTSGLCILGPCRGDSLWQITANVKDAAVFIDAGELPAPPLAHD